MAEGSTDAGSRIAGDPEALRAAMASTRAALTQEFSALRARTLGPRKPATTRGRKIVAAQKTGSKSGNAKAKAPAAKAPTAKSVGKKASGGAKSKVKSVMDEAKEVLGEVLVGAAAGAVKGAAEVVSERTDEAAEAAERAAPTQGKKGAKSPKAKAGSGK